MWETYFFFFQNLQEMKLRDNDYIKNDNVWFKSENA